MQRKLSLRVPPITHDDIHLDPQVIAAVRNATRQIVQHGAYINPDGTDVYLEDAQEFLRQHTVIYTPQQIVPTPRAKYQGVATFVHQQTTVTVAHERVKLGYRVAVVHCGAGELFGHAGAATCHESLVRCSSMAVSIDMIAAGGGIMPQWNDDTIVVMPQVPVFRSHDGDLLRAPWLVDIVSAAPIDTPPVVYEQHDRRAELPLLMARRAERIVDAAAGTGANVLVLGVWGCAEHVVEPALIAAAFRVALERPCARAFAIVDVAAADTSNAQVVYQTYARRFHEQFL